MTHQKPYGATSQPVSPTTSYPNNNTNHRVTENWHDDSLRAHTNRVLEYELNLIRLNIDGLLDEQLELEGEQMRLRVHCARAAAALKRARTRLQREQNVGDTITKNTANPYKATTSARLQEIQGQADLGSQVHLALLARQLQSVNSALQQRVDEYGALRTCPRVEEIASQTASVQERLRHKSRHRDLAVQHLEAARLRVQTMDAEILRLEKEKKSLQYILSQAAASVEEQKKKYSQIHRRVLGAEKLPNGKTLATEQTLKLLHAIRSDIAFSGLTILEGLGRSHDFSLESLNAYKGIQSVLAPVMTPNPRGL